MDEKTPVHHNTVTEARNQFFEDFGRATITGQWMAAIWKIEDGKIVVKRVTTYDFPKGDMVGAIGELANHLHNANFAPVPEPEPLPTVFPDQWKPSVLGQQEDQDGNGH